MATLEKIANGVRGSLLMGILLSGCDDGSSAKLKQYKVPLWHSRDLEYNKFSGSKFVYEHVLHIKPPFYNGATPLRYNSSETPGRGHVYGSPQALMHQFANHDNLFIYEAGMLTGAVAVHSAQRTLAAEARFSYQVKDNKQTITMEEFHYGPKGLIFHCVSDIDSDMGTKSAEREPLGRKEQEYFFLLPLGVNN